jgi:hypothetical protein
LCQELTKTPAVLMNETNYKTDDGWELFIVHPEVVDLGSGQGRSYFTTAGVAALRRGLQKSENTGLGRKMPFLGGQYLLEDIHTIRPTQRFHVLARKVALIYTNNVCGFLDLPPVALFIGFYQA